MARGECDKGTQRRREEDGGRMPPLLKENARTAQNVAMTGEYEDGGKMPPLLEENARTAQDVATTGGKRKVSSQDANAAKILLKLGSG